MDLQKRTVSLKTTRLISTWRPLPLVGPDTNSIVFSNVWAEKFCTTTQTVIYVGRPGEYDPALEDYLGELTIKLNHGEHIVKFVSGGPKNYAYKTNNGNEMCKVRGFTLHFTNSQLINFEAVKFLHDPQN